MPPKKFLIAVGVLVVGALAVWWWIRRQAAGAMAAGASAATPTPQAAITSLLAPAPGQPLGALPGAVTQYAVDQAGRLLPPVVGAGVNAIIPQSTPRPPVATGSQDGGVVDSVNRGGVLGSLGRGILEASVSPSYRPNVGYYG